MEEAIAHDLLCSLVAMAASDGRIGKREVRHIERVVAKNGLAPELLEKALAQAELGEFEVTLPPGMKERKGVFFELVKLAAVDGVIEAGERELLETLAQHIGISDSKLDSLIALAMSAGASTRARAVSAPKSLNESSGESAPPRPKPVTAPRPKRAAAPRPKPVTAPLRARPVAHTAGELPVVHAAEALRSPIAIAPPPRPAPLDENQEIRRLDLGISVAAVVLVMLLAVSAGKARRQTLIDRAEGLAARRIKKAERKVDKERERLDRRRAGIKQRIARWQLWEQEFDRRFRGR